MSGIPYLGSKISLISKSEIRYEGILVDVNPQESTITFEQVRFFGTEGRRPTDEIAPMDRIFDCVVFRSADIKDLQVYETAKEEVEVKKPEFPDPAVVSFTGATRNSTATSTATATSTSISTSTGPSGFQYQSKSSSSSKLTEEVKMPKINNYASAASAPQQQQSQQQQQQQQQQTKSFSTRNRSTSNSSINNNNTSNINNNFQRSRSTIVVPRSEFDFSQANAKFSKDEMTATVPEEQVTPSYNKNLSFFDDISCQANTESMKSIDHNRNERNLNMETFGQSAPPRRYTRGRGRGGYRGSYNNRTYNNYNNYNNSNSNANNNANNSNEN